MLPLKASSGRTSRSRPKRSSTLARLKTASARLRLLSMSPTWGASCRHAIFMVGVGRGRWVALFSWTGCLEFQRDTTRNRIWSGVESGVDVSPVAQSVPLCPLPGQRRGRGEPLPPRDTDAVHPWPTVMHWGVERGDVCVSLIWGRGRGRGRNGTREEEESLGEKNQAKRRNGRKHRFLGSQRPTA